MPLLEAAKSRSRRRVPESLVYERWGGRMYYRRGYRDVDYLFEKAQTYLHFGTETVFWVLSSVRKVFIFKQGQEAVIQDWSTDLHLLDGVTVNVGAYLAAEGVTLTKES